MPFGETFHPVFIILFLCRLFPSESPKKITPKIQRFHTSVKIWDINNSKDLEMHKDVLEYIVEDMHPWSVKQYFT